MDFGNAISVGVLNVPHPNQLPTIGGTHSLSVLVETALLMITSMGETVGKQND